MKGATNGGLRRSAAAWRQRPPVFLLGGVNLVRAFGLAGIPVIVASTEARPPATFSRYCAGACRLPAAADGETLARALLAAVEPVCDAIRSRVPLFCGNDFYLRLLQDHRDLLSGRFLMLLNEPATAEALIDKSLFQSLASARGIAVSRTLDPDTAASLEGPVLVKPKSKAALHDITGKTDFFTRSSKARVFESGRAAVDAVTASGLSGSLLFQEYVRGDDRSLWSFNGFADEEGRLLEWFIGRKIRTFPPLTGESSYIELAHDDELAELGRQIVSRIPLRGLFKIDLKRDSITGRFYVLEVNARCTLWLHLGARNGVNLAAVAYEYLTAGARPAHVEARTDYRWLFLRLDYRAYRQLASAGSLSTLRWLRSLAESRKIYHTFSWTDPAPFIRHLWSRVGSARKWLRRRKSWLSTAS